jgi:hypothetical protein
MPHPGRRRPGDLPADPNSRYSRGHRTDTTGAGEPSGNSRARAFGWDVGPSEKNVNNMGDTLPNSPDRASGATSVTDWRRLEQVACAIRLNVVGRPAYRLAPGRILTPLGATTSAFRALHSGAEQAWYGPADAPDGEDPLHGTAREALPRESGPRVPRQGPAGPGRAFRAPSWISRHPTRHYPWNHRIIVSAPNERPCNRFNAIHFVSGGSGSPRTAEGHFLRFSHSNGRINSGSDRPGPFDFLRQPWPGIARHRCARPGCLACGASPHVADRRTAGVRHGGRTGGTAVPTVPLRRGSHTPRTHPHAHCR